MLILIFFALAAGIVTILSPCILPVLPIVLSGSIITGRRRPFAIFTGFILSFTFFTLFLSAIVRATGLPPDTLRTLAILIIAIFGISLITNIEFFTFSFVPKTTNGFLLGMSLGLVWAPCVGPILASVIALAITGTVNGATFFITLAYAIGTAIPLFAILYGGRNMVQKIPNPANIQKFFGILMVLIAIAMALNLDRKFQIYVLAVFPKYGSGLTSIETIPQVLDAIKKLQKSPADTSSQGKPLFNVLQSSMNNAPELTGGQEWFNSKPLALKNLRGKVVMVDFWTYTCINCIRTLPYTKAWYEKYKDKGFVIIGVHTPEFEFEKDAGNVGRAVKDFGITYPVVQDNNYAIWNAYGNQYWPADYLINKEGKIVDTHFGEGDYDATEKKIQSLLNVDMPIHNPASNIHTQTPETYVGLSRLGALASPEQPVAGQTQNYTVPDPLPYNTFAFGGAWTESSDRAMPSGSALGAAQLLYHFDATNVYLVMRPRVAGISGKVQIYLDGTLRNELIVDTDRLYDIVKLPAQGEHILQLKFLDSNLELYAFTFG